VRRFTTPTEIFEQVATPATAPTSAPTLAASTDAISKSLEKSTFVALATTDVKQFQIMARHLNRHYKPIRFHRDPGPTMWRPPWTAASGTPLKGLAHLVGLIRKPEKSGIRSWMLVPDPMA